MKVSYKALKKIILQEAKSVLKESSGMLKYSKTLEWDQVEAELPEFADILNDQGDEEAFGAMRGSPGDIIKVATKAFSRMTGYDGPARVNIDDIGSGIQMDIMGSKEDIAEALAEWGHSTGSPVSMEEIEEEVEMNSKPMSGGMY